MKLLVIDEDTTHVPHIIDEFRQLENEVVQLTDWQGVQTRLGNFRPDALLLDLMMPPNGLPLDECNAGFTTGAYVYKTELHKLFVGIPFALFSAAYLDAGVIRQADEDLKQFAEYRGLIAKGEDAEDIIRKLS